uniref:Ig-like domain-containing protein n=1 Tax=Sciurus vulgaris TaxID=55149 RepID=A0A8D2D086_SCIVU
MGTCISPRLLCVTLCLLGTGLMDAGITQKPRHLILHGGKGSLKCYPMSGHNSVSWYQQAPAQGPQFLVQYFEKLQRSKGNFPDRFSAQQFGDYHSELNMSTLQLGDSATYLCASSLHSPVESLAFCTQTFLSLLSVFQGEEVWVATQTEPRPMRAPSSWLALCLPC